MKETKMEMRMKMKEMFRQNWLLFVILAAGFLVRLLFLADYPGGVNQDEAFAGWFAYALGTEGIDNFGFGNPVYFTAWGSGMNALYSYLAIPFVKLFGLNAWGIRLPQAIISCLSLIAFYKLLQKSFDRETALCGVFLLAVNPWHITMSRWGLESALAPAFVLFGLLFFNKGMENGRWLILSALMYGLSLYCYATVWMPLPFVLLVQLIYALRSRKVRFDRYLAGFVIVLGVTALPLFLFLAVNTGLIPQIATRWISIPKMAYFRGGEFALTDIGEHLGKFLKMFFAQQDSCIWNAVPGFGYYYHFSWPFIAIGFVSCLRAAVRAWKEKRYDVRVIFLALFVFSVIEALLMSKCEMNKINLLHLPVIFFCALGVHSLISCGGKKLGAAIFLLYLASFAMFLHTYTHEYNETVSEAFDEGDTEAVRFAASLGEQPICVHLDVYYPKIYYALQMSPSKAAEETQYQNYPAKFLSASHLGDFEFHVNLKEEYLDRYDVIVWINREEDREILRSRGYRIKEFGNFLTAYR